MTSCHQVKVSDSFPLLSKKLFTPPYSINLSRPFCILKFTYLNPLFTPGLTALSKVGISPISTSDSKHLIKPEEGTPNTE